MRQRQRIRKRCSGSPSEQRRLVCRVRRSHSKRRMWARTWLWLSSFFGPAVQFEAMFQENHDSGDQEGCDTVPGPKGALLVVCRSFREQLEWLKPSFLFGRLPKAWQRGLIGGLMAL